MNQIWNAESLEVRYAHVGRVVVKTATVDTVVGCMARAYDSFGTRPEGQIASVIGHTRYGKTTGVRIFMSQIARIKGGDFVEVTNLSSPTQSVTGADYVVLYEDAQILRPVIRISIGPSPTYKGLMFDTIFAITQSSPSRTHSHARLVKLLITQLREQQTRLIIFDEAHRICREGSTPANVLSGDVFATIAKEAKVEVALVGREETRILFNVNKELQAMREQDFAIAPLPFPDRDDADYVRFLKTFKKSMPFDGPCDIASLDVAKAMHAFTTGSPGMTSLLLQLGTKYAIEKGLGTVDRDVLGWALRDFRGITGDANPFLAYRESRP